MFVVGRAVCGLGISAVNSATLTLITHLFPPHKRSIWLSLVGTSQSVGLSCAPVIGGALIDRFSWRACFGINLPLCPLLIVFTAFFLHDPIRNPNYELSMLEKLKRVDLLGTALVVPSVTCLLIGLQWGGIRYGWQDVRIIVLLVVFVCLGVGFAYLQYRLGEKATIPPRIVKKRSVLAGMWFSACCNGILATTEYYIAIYWQGVRNQTATQAGLLGLSMIIGLSVASVLAGFGISKVGYFTREYSGSFCGYLDQIGYL
jgi:MFS family permease